MRRNPVAIEKATAEMNSTPGTGVPARRSLSIDSLLTSVGKTLVGLMNFAAAVVVARQFGPAGRGEVAIGLTLVLILMQVGNLGLTSANPYFAAQDRSHVRFLLANTVAWSAAVGGLLAAGLVAVRAFVPSAIAGTTLSLVIVTAVAVPFGLAAVLLQGILLGEGRTLAYNGVEATSAVGAVALLVLAGILSHPSPAGALAILLGQYPAASAVYLLLLSRDIERPRVDRAFALLTIRFGARVYVGMVLSFLVIRLDLLLVNGFLGQAQAGLYSVAAVIAQGLIVIPYAIGTNLMPRVAQGGLAEFSAMIFRSVAVVYGGVCLLMLPLAWPVVHLLYGSRFDAAVPMVLWLLPGTYAFGMLTILSLHFTGRGYPLALTWIWAAGVLINVVLNLVLLPLFGTVMASVTSTVTYVIVLVLHMGLFARIDPPAPSLRPSPRETFKLIQTRIRPGQAHVL
jgi:O-antigen/teichoic acid export membrane protein